jgi:alpha-galactosidase
VSLGLRDLGYEYVVLDDCWQDPHGRDKNGKLQSSLEKFPKGLNSISDHLHSQNLKFGMYSSAGEMTCARFGKITYQKRTPGRMLKLDRGIVGSRDRGC